jgi:formylglycine-generating enzyme required for sulfatase activity
MIQKIVLFSSVSIFLLMSAEKSPDKRSLKRSKKLVESFCAFIPSGLTVIDGDTSSVQAFYMSKTEITNSQYNEFLAYLKRNKRFDDLKIAQVDSSKWNQGSSLNSKYAEYYHGHPAYKEYPVVNITREGAEMYCEWLTMYYDSLSNGTLKLKFRLPLREEHVRAARGDNHDHVYPWGGIYLRNTQGQPLCNFVRLDETNITKSDRGYEVKLLPNYSMAGVFDILAPAKSYWPNEFGIYNLSGNASELIAKEEKALGGDWSSPGYDVRITSEKAYAGASPMIGFRVVASYVQN